MATVSILMPARNAAATIGAAMASVQAQSVQDWELLVIDDASNDATARSVETRAGSDPRIRLLRSDGQQGAAAARNLGLDAACGRYIAFLDADDEWFPDKLERQLVLMFRTGAALSYAGFITRSAGRPDREITVSPTVSYDRLLSGNIIGCLTAMYDTDICGKVPMPLIRRRHDYALWLTLLKAHGCAHGIPEPLAVLHLSRGTLSSNKLAATYDTWRMYRNVIGLSAPASLVYLCRHLTQRISR